MLYFGHYLEETNMAEADIRAVIFDMGGVFIRTEDQTPRQRLAERLGLPVKKLLFEVFDSPSANLALVGKIDEHEHWQNIGNALGLAGDDLAHFRREFWAGDRWDKEIIDFLRSLRPAHKTALLSNAWSGLRRVLTEIYPSMDAFDVQVISAEVGLAKPDSAIYRLVLERLGVEPQQAVFVDDFIENIEAANALGIHAVRFTSAAQALTDVRALLNHSA